jgi:hypothetical protein
MGAEEEVPRGPVAAAAAAAERKDGGSAAGTVVTTQAAQRRARRGVDGGVDPRWRSYNLDAAGMTVSIEAAWRQCGAAGRGAGCTGW